MRPTCPDVHQGMQKIFRGAGCSLSAGLPRAVPSPPHPPGEPAHLGWPHEPSASIPIARLDGTAATLGDLTGGRPALVVNVAAGAG